MYQHTCQKLREKLENIKALKMTFGNQLASVQSFEQIEKLKIAQEELNQQITELERVVISEQIIVKKLKKQYYEQIRLGAEWGFFEKDRPIIVGIDGKSYAAPTWDQIMFTLTPDHLKKIYKIRKPALMVVPFGLSFRSMIEKIKKIISVDRPNFNFPTVQQRYEDINYFGGLREDSKGYLKEEILKMTNSFNKFPGWQVVIIDGGKGLSPKTLNDHPHNVLRKLKAEGLDVLNVEEWLFFAIKKLSNKADFLHSFKKSICWMNSFLPKMDQCIYSIPLGFSEKNPIDFYDYRLCKEQSILYGSRIVLRIN